MGESVPLWAIVAFIVLLLAAVVLLVLVVQLRKRLAKFMTGKDGMSLEATLEWLTKKTADVDETLKEHQEGLRYIDNRVKRSIRGYSLVRYDAYIGAGGAQSFSTGLLDEQADGFILSVVTSRNHTGVYAKKIIAGIAEASLTEEETLALEEAKKGIK